ncbi:MAG: selenide, water dikinase SelD, partial [Betaproteobacteria bacterium]|nr:selenide, water dikinase SelD [Betaproteobacteria bacterium]
SAIPFFERALILAKKGEATGASARNLKSCAGEFCGAPEKTMQTLLSDPQTGGGLLAACAPETAAEVLEVFRQNGCPRAAVIGEIKTGAGVIVE